MSRVATPMLRVFRSLEKAPNHATAMATTAVQDAASVPVTTSQFSQPQYGTMYRPDLLSISKVPPTSADSVEVL
ncbi:hypothetical protein AU184_02680 [Mycolicibacterium novocastrense]|nr:hypothetical protein AU072_05175 [Mycolicibacterium novocastrense]KUH72575.1 hypothetical protein AU184_02680 [Mycolicibacterium novocastrense]KUH78464.1 hypothetical protein AU183_07915 [Mycolicibacterium novocastrense]